MGQNRPKFRVLYAKKHTCSKKVHRRRLLQLWFIWALHLRQQCTSAVVSKSVYCSLYFDQIFCFPDHHHRYRHFNHHNKKCLKVYTLSAERLYHWAFADMGSSFNCIAALSRFHTRNTKQDSTNTIFRRGCWHWSFSSFSPWLPQKMRYSKTLVKEPTKIFFAPKAVWIHRPLLSYNFSSGLFCTWIYCPYAFFSCGVECFASGFFCFFSINGTIIVAAIDIAAQQSNSFKLLVFSYVFGCFFFRL